MAWGKAKPVSVPSAELAQQAKGKAPDLEAQQPQHAGPKASQLERAASGASAGSSARGNNKPPVIGKPGPISKLLFLFIDPLIRWGHRTTLEPEDLYKLESVHIDRVHGLFDAAWQRELKTGKPDIRKAVIANSIGGLLFTGLLYCVSLASQLVGPMMLSRIVSGLSCWASQGGVKGGRCPSSQDLYYYVIAISLAPLVQSLAENHMQYGLNIIGIKMRNGLMAAIYRKCLRLSNSALQSESTGKVVTLMSNDAQKVQDVMLAIHTLWGAPTLIVVILVLLYQQVGWATFVGLAVMAAYSPLSTKVSARLIGLRRGLMVWTDKRVGLMNEIVNSIQMIKFYAWERPFRARVMQLRDREAAILKRIIWWQSLFAMLLFSGPVMMAVAVFAVYAIAGIGTFGPANAYTSLALFNLLRLPLAFLPMMITMLINALVALNRIGEFLQKPESGLAALREAAASTPPGVVRVEGGDFTWEAGSDAPSLKGVDLVAQPGSLTMVVGSVGSGKSSLLAALIGQMERVKGSVAVGGRVAYVAQTAWIINDSVQENVIMGEAFDATRYRVTVDVACLVPDLELLPNGDATEIGDRGVTLSGGQKQRVSIARAVYTDADVFLLDDPLSAVDSHVGRALFERTIRGVLKGRTVILVTNALQYLPYADNVLWMENGAVRAQGRYAQLVEAGLNVAELVHMEGESEGEGASSELGSEQDGTEFWQPAGPPLAEEEEEEEPAVGVASTGSAPARSERGEAEAPSPFEHSQRISGAGGAQAAAGAAGSGAEPVSSDDLSNGSTPKAIITARGPAAAEVAALAAGSATAAPGSLPQAGSGAQRGPSSPRSKKSSSSGGGGGSLRARRSVGGEARHLPPGDIASAGSVVGASLKLAASGAPASRSLSLVRLAAEGNRNLTGVEAREKGNVSGLVLRTYIAAGGGALVALLIVAIMAVEQAARVFTDTWLAYWASNLFNQGMWFYIGIYAALGILYSLLTFLRTLRFMFTTVNAAVQLHNRLLDHLLRLPKVFFDQNPAGRILNRFSRDVETMDSVLNQSMVQFCNCFAAYLAILVVISVATRWFGIAIAPITGVYVLIQRYYIPSARELQRIESVTRSPIYSKFSEALAGASTIRAYAREAYFTASSDALMELNAYAFATQRAAASWLAMRLDLLGLVILTIAAMLCISGSISPGLAGLCLVYALDITRYLKHGTAMASKTESDFNSVERVVQYLTPASEAAEDTPPEVAAKMPPNWPEAGAIAVRDLQLRYRPGLPLVLRGLSFDVAPGEKVGLVGRTGSGKSSLLLALFRMVEADAGSICIDGVDISRVGLQQLRSQMSIIPQDPFMFSGSVRSNLDPFESYTEPDLWRVLGAVGLKDTIAGLDAKLDAPVVDGGNNFSQGQKQLFCMARAMLRNSRVLMLDEATASVDPETDRLIQGAIRSVFTATTMLTIAHRLNTIMDADRVLVLDQGRLIENGEPHELLQREAGIFTGMVSQTGSASATYLKDVARAASSDRAALRAHSSVGGMQQQQQEAGIQAALSPALQGLPGRLQGRPVSVTAQALADARRRQGLGASGHAHADAQLARQLGSGEGAGGQDHGGGGEAQHGGMSRSGSELGLSRYGPADEPMSAFAATSGAGLTRELSTLQRNAAAHPSGALGAVMRRLSSEGLEDQRRAPGPHLAPVAERSASCGSKQ